MRYKVSVPPTSEMGSYTTTAEATALETMRQNALWDYNKAREHDGLAPVRRMPAGTTYAATATKEQSTHGLFRDLMETGSPELRAEVSRALGRAGAR